MDMDLHLARVQQRWRYADDELAPGEALTLDTLAHDVALLPDHWEASPEEAADDLLDFFSPPLSANNAAGGSIEPVITEIADADGVLITEAATSEPLASP